jgi:hypothetical protein
LATAIVTDRFAPTAQVMAQVSGRPGHPFAVIPHPISHNSDAELREKAVDAVQQCARILLTHEHRGENTRGHGGGSGEMVQGIQGEGR